MVTEESIQLYNKGNSSAYFKFVVNKERLFSPKVLEGNLKSKEKLSIPITLSVPVPTAKKNDYHYTERIIMKVLDGNETTFTCSYSVSDPKYSVKCDLFSKPNTLCLGHALEDTLELKNQSKHPLVLHVQGTGIEISEKIKLSPDENKKLRVKFVGKEVGAFPCSIEITPRGGQKRILENVMTVIEPMVAFSKETL